MTGDALSSGAGCRCPLRSLRVALAGIGGSSEAMGAKMEILDGFYERVDAEVCRVTERGGMRLRCCPGCRTCCVDELTVFEVEAENIRRRHAGLLRQGSPHPEGACAFLDEAGECRIYEHRPYVCRTQGLPLRWIEEGDDEEPYEMRDICPLNEEGCDLLELDPESCWTIGPFEEQLREIQSACRDGSLDRVSLRSLFLSP